MSLTVLLIICALLVAVALIGFKLLPAYTEFFTVKKVISDLSRNPELKGASPKEISDAFDRRATIDNIKALGGRDLEIAKQGDRSSIRAVWSVKVHLFYNVSACIDFEATGQ
jgi:hypothetical protein